MSTDFTALTPSLYQYLLRNSLRESDLLAELREETSKLDMSIMQIAPEQGQFLSLLVHLLKVKTCIEVGVFTGYSSVCLASALPSEGKLIACDVSEEWTNMARKYWQRAKLQDKIELHLQPATQTLQTLLDQGHQASFDLIFIDADKVHYKIYYELSLQLLKPGAVMLIDNVLWGGSVLDEQDNSPDTLAIRELNEHIHQDSRVEMSMLPLADGLTIVRRNE